MDTKEITDNGYKVAKEREISKIGASLKEIYSSLLEKSKHKFAIFKKN